MNISETISEKDLGDIHLGTSSCGDGVPLLRLNLSNLSQC